MGPAPAVASVRWALRRSLSDLPRDALALVACSGGPDSLALAAAVAFEVSRGRLRAGAVTVDHALQPGSAGRAAELVGKLRRYGLDPVESVRVSVGVRGGPEAAARDARYEALDAAATRLGAAAVLLGHTADDQAETVLLGLARGSGTRSLAGMPPVSGLYRRPLLGLFRATTRAACSAESLDAWADPHNTDPGYTRVRLRRQALPALERALGGGVAPALARSADLLRDDADALDEWARHAEAEATCRAPEGAGASGELALDVHVLAGLPAAVRRRVLRRGAVAAGSPAGALAAVHLRAVEALVTGWHGQRGADLPGGLRARRQYGTLLFTRVRID